jgi:hypothetical protein
MGVDVHALDERVDFDGARRFQREVLELIPKCSSSPAGRFVDLVIQLSSSRVTSGHTTVPRQAPLLPPLARTKRAGTLSGSFFAEGDCPEAASTVTTLGAASCGGAPIAVRQYIESQRPPYTRP